MQTNHSLAIVIPAYKVAFLADSLESIANQTNKNFNLYIGNDHSPHDIDAVVDLYRSRINLTYKKFPDNLGSVSLVKHWERCIDLSVAEEWIWLFSDDDLMDENAVEEFLKLEKNEADVYRFNLKIVDLSSRFLNMVNYPESESAISFLQNRLLFNYENVMSNYIFSRDTYKTNKGFVDFPLAWGSDDASITLFAERGMIRTIQDSFVSWRSSGINITTDLNVDILKRKFAARFLFVKWLYTVKADMTQKMKNDKLIIGQWYYRAMQAECGWATPWLKFVMLSKVAPFVGSHVYKYLIRDLRGVVSKSIRARLDLKERI